MRRPTPGKASPRKSLSTPAMMRSSVDFPLPLAPMTPIFAPWKNESQMPCKISRLGGTTLRRSFMTNAYSPAMPLVSYRRSDVRAGVLRRRVRRRPTRSADRGLGLPCGPLDLDGRLSLGARGEVRAAPRMGHDDLREVGAAQRARI